jgi:hypothetical protein
MCVFQKKKKKDEKMNNRDLSLLSDEQIDQCLRLLQQLRENVYELLVLDLLDTLCTDCLADIVDNALDRGIAKTKSVKSEGQD